MLGIIVTGHGNFASGILSAVELIAGKMENVIGIDFRPDDSGMDLENNLKEALDKLESYPSKVILTDLMGGTPFKTSVVLGMERENCTVIYGTNLPMVLEFALSTESGDDLDKLVNKALEISKEQINKFQLVLEEDNQQNDEEGI